MKNEDHRKQNLLSSLASTYRQRQIREVRDDPASKWSILEYIEFTVDDFKRFKGQPIISQEDIDNMARYHS